MAPSKRDTLRRESDELLRRFETSPDPMWVFDIRTFAFLAVNDAAIRRYGFSRSEFLSMTILDIRPNEDVLPLIHEELRDRKHNSDRERWRHRTRAGRIFNVEISSRAITFGTTQAEIVLAREVGPGQDRDISAIDETKSSLPRWKHPGRASR